VPLRKRSRQLTELATFAALIATSLALIPQQIYAQQSEVKQEILPPDCSIRSSCNIGKPTIGSIDKNSGRPIITGTYDVTNTKNLVITLGGVVYTLGSSSELTAQRGVWRLDLSSLVSPLALGRYELVIEAMGYNDQKSEARAVIELLPSDIKDDEQKPAERSDDPLVPQPLTVAQSSLVPLRIVLIATIVTLGLYILAMRRRKHRLEVHNHDIIHSNDT